MNGGRFDSDDAYATPQKERVQQSQPYEQPRIRKPIHCTMCILSSTMALWSKAEIEKYTF